MKTGNLNGQGIAELQNYKIQNLSSAPTTNLSAGRFYYNTTDNTLYVYDGTQWVDALSQGDYTFQNGVELVSNTRNVQIKIASGANAGNVTLTADSNGLSGSVTELEVDSGSANYLDITNHKISAKVDTTVTTSSNKLVTSGAVDTAIANALTGALKYQGTWTATSQTDYSSITLPAKKGYMYAVSGSATIGGVEWNAGDYLVINKDVASGGTITSSDVDKIDNTEASDIVRLNATQILTNKTIDADNNTISDLTTSNLKSGVLQTTVRGTSSASDTSIPSEKAVSSAIAGLSYSTTNPALTSSGGYCNFVVTHNLGSTDVETSLYEVATGDKVMYDVTITSANVVTYKILSASNISANTYNATVKK